MPLKTTIIDFPHDFSRLLTQDEARKQNIYQNFPPLFIIQTLCQP